MATVSFNVVPSLRESLVNCLTLRVQRCNDNQRKAFALIVARGVPFRLVVKDTTWCPRGATLWRSSETMTEVCWYPFPKDGITTVTTRLILLPVMAPTLSTRRRRDCCIPVKVATTKLSPSGIYNRTPTALLLFRPRVGEKRR